MEAERAELVPGHLLDVSEQLCQRLNMDELPYKP